MLTLLPKKLYLAGPITGLSYDDAAGGWRQVAADLLARQSPHILPYSPMRAKEFLKNNQVMPHVGDELDALPALARPEGIITRDFNDVSTADAILANLHGAKRISIGTVWEIGAAYALRKPVVLVCEPGNVHEHAFVTHTVGYRVHTLEEAIPIIGSLLTPGL